MGLVTSKYTLRTSVYIVHVHVRYNTCNMQLSKHRGQIGKRFSCKSMLVRAALVLLLAPLCLCAGKEPQLEERVYKTKEWKDSSRPLILTKQS